MVRKIRFFIGVSFYRLVKLVFYIPRALIDSFTLSGASAALAPAPLHYVLVWFLYGFSSEHFLRIRREFSEFIPFLLRSECSDSLFYVSDLSG